MADLLPDIFGSPSQLSSLTSGRIPVPIANAGDNATRRFLEFFTVTIRNRNTRAAYARAAWAFFEWCHERGLPLERIEPIIVSLYIEELIGRLSAPSVKQHLAAIRMLFDWLVTGHVVAANPAASVRGPKYSSKKGKTPVLLADEAAELLRSIPDDSIAGIRDRALISVMVYSFARVSAAIGMNVEDYAPRGRRMWFRLHEKGGKFHEVPAHHKAEELMDAYMAATGIDRAAKTPLFRSLDRRRNLTDRRIHRSEVLAMIKRRSRQSGLPPSICCHTFRATGITAYLSNGGTLENAQRIAAHESPRTTSLYDRTSDELSLDEIERIRI